MILLLDACQLRPQRLEIVEGPLDHLSQKLVLRLHPLLLLLQNPQLQDHKKLSETGFERCKFFLIKLSPRPR